MKIQTLAPVLAAALAFAAVAHADDKKSSPSGDRFEQFKQLAGDWVGTASGHGPDEKDVHVQFKVTAGGSAVVETEFPGTEHEMVTVITQDGDDLSLTHYCMLGNQPHMKTAAKGATDKIPFQFVSVGNANPDKDMFMHDVTYTFVDKDTLKAEWSHCHDGKVQGTVVIELKRKK
ncbi:MAG TPA: hypothetical protein VMS17_07430 [Gemmataceae bacterium]|nr:hypothetical protein [Gemmataceae bacterium]